jgi:hypothetical protein
MMRPMQNVMRTRMRDLVKLKVQQYLLSDDYNEWYKDLFVAVDEYFPAERSIHTAVPPANVRIKNYTAKQLPQFDECVR